MKMKKREGSNSGEYSCSMCSFRSVSFLNVEAHDRFAHKDKKTLNDRTSLYDGQSKGPTRYACAQCPFESTVKSTLLAHVHSNHLIVRVPNNNNNIGKDRSSFFS
uniref:C2H2-type domain-containing protein n=1 Tax=Lygus hesperus TaxID=30085 RepID=A0A0A9XHD4_LYGHE